MTVPLLQLSMNILVQLSLSSAVALTHLEDPDNAKLAYEQAVTLET